MSPLETVVRQLCAVERGSSHRFNLYGMPIEVKRIWHPSINQDEWCYCVAGHAWHYGFRFDDVVKKLVTVARKYQPSPWEE